MTPDENLEFRVIGTENDAAPCENCGHDYLHHVTLYGVSIPCDYELIVSMPMGMCGCKEYVPKQQGENECQK